MVATAVSLKRVQVRAVAAVFVSQKALDVTVAADVDGRRGGRRLATAVLEVALQQRVPLIKQYLVVVAVALNVKR